MRRIIENSTIVFCRKNKEKKRNKIFSNVFIFNQTTKFSCISVLTTLLTIINHLFFLFRIYSRILWFIRVTDKTMRIKYINISDFIVHFIRFQSIHDITMRVLRRNEVKEWRNANWIPKGTLPCAIFDHI